MNKYRAKKTEVDGLVFDSGREAKRYRELSLMQRAGEIEDLRRQIPYDLIVNGVKICRYIADFGYTDRRTRSLVIEDSKGVRTRDYKLKAKLMLAIHGIEILET